MTKLSDKLEQDIIKLIGKSPAYNGFRHIKILGIVNIKMVDNANYTVTYVYSEYDNNTKRIFFNTNVKFLNLTNEIRDAKLEHLFNSDRNISFDIEEYIYTEEERNKLHSLRSTDGDNILITMLNESDLSKNRISLEKIKKEYSESFHIGQKIWYNNDPGFITFKHLDKGENQITRWSVKVKDTEFRYVDGLLLYPREVQDLSNIEVDPILNKLSTEKLLKIMKNRRKLNRGQGDLKIKRILQDREHVRVTEDKIVNKG